MRIIKLTESELTSLIKRVINEGLSEIDAILDKISEVGFDGLSDDEKEYLEYHSKTGKFLPTEKPEVSFNASDSEDAIKRKVGGIKFKFLHEDTFEENGIVNYSGWLGFNNEEFYGRIICDENGDYLECSFEDPEQNEIIDLYPDIEMYLDKFLEYVCEELNQNGAY